MRTRYNAPRFDPKPMVRKNMYITQRQDTILRFIRAKIRKPESVQIREALDLYFFRLGIKR